MEIFDSGEVARGKGVEEWMLMTVLSESLMGEDNKVYDEIRAAGGRMEVDLKVNGVPLKFSKIAIRYAEQMGRLIDDAVDKRIEGNISAALERAKDKCNDIYDLLQSAEGGMLQHLNGVYIDEDDDDDDDDDD